MLKVIASATIEAEAVVARLVAPTDDVVERKLAGRYRVGSSGRIDTVWDTDRSRQKSSRLARIRAFEALEMGKAPRLFVHPRIGMPGVNPWAGCGVADVWVSSPLRTPAFFGRRWSGPIENSRRRRDVFDRSIVNNGAVGSQNDCPAAGPASGTETADEILVDSLATMQTLASKCVLHERCRRPPQAAPRHCADSIPHGDRGRSPPA